MAQHDAVYPPLSVHANWFSLQQNALFLQVVDRIKLKSVAQILHISSTSVTRQLKQLELALGVKLLDRANGSNKLTQAGKAFFPQAQRIFQHQLNIVLAAQSSSNGSTEREEADTTTAKFVAGRLTLPHIQAFVTVVLAGGLGAAARSTLQTQSSLSRRIKHLEARLNTSLLVRKSTGVVLTPVGQCVMPHAVDLLAQHSLAQECMHLWQLKAQSNLIIVGSLAVMPPVMPRLLLELKTNFPQKCIEVRSAHSDRVEHEVQQGNALVGVCGVVSEKPHFTYTPLLQVQLGLIWAPPLQVPSFPSNLNALARIPLVRFSDNALISQVLVANKTQFASYFDSPVTVDGVESGMDLVRSGQFAMVVTGIGASRSAAQGLQFLPMPHLLPIVNVSLITCRNSPYDERREQLCQALANSVVKTRWHSSVRLLRWPLVQD